jgi:hypothetical protein
MEKQNEDWQPPITDEELSAMEPKKPEGLTPEQSQRWDDLDYDRKLLIKEGVFASGFWVFGKGLNNRQ